MAPSYSPLLKTVRDGLNYCTVDQIKKLLNLLPIKTQVTRKAELVSAVEGYLLGAGLQQLWQELDDLQQAAVAETVYADEPYFRADKFAAKYGSLPEWKDTNLLYRYNAPAAKLDLFFYPPGQYSDNYVLHLDLRQQLQTFVPEPQPLELPSHDHLDDQLKIPARRSRYGTRSGEAKVVPLTLSLREQAAQQDLLAVLRLVHLGKVSVSDKTLMPSKATMKAIAPLLQSGDYYDGTAASDDGLGTIQPFAWVMLLQGGGLAKATGKKLELTRAGQKAMNAPPAKTIQSVWKKWQKTTVLDELRRVEAIKGQTGKGKRILT